MKNKDFLSDKYVYEEYDRWINYPYLFTTSDYFARERFYDFVIACVKYVKYQPFITKNEAWKRINMDTLKEHIEADLAELKDDNYDLFEQRVHDLLVDFENLIRYEKRRYARGLR